MAMSRFIDEADRFQGTLLPETIDEYVAEENPVRVIEAFVEALDLAELGFRASSRMRRVARAITRRRCSRSTSTGT
jgi:transposase